MNWQPAAVQPLIILILIMLIILILILILIVIIVIIIVSRPAAGQAVTWCALSLCIANSLNQQYGAAAPGDEKPGPFFGDPML